MIKPAVILILLNLFLIGPGFTQSTRKSILLNNDWRSIANAPASGIRGFESMAYNDKKWQRVNVPHNWDQYEGYRRLLHGNLHGTAWYRKVFTVNESSSQKHFFLYFEGVGSYATVWLNGKKVGRHAGGRTTFTIDVSAEIKRKGQANILAVRADHPANIKDLPWVDGGCSPERGFSEGSQPMGIFRPVHLIVTNGVKVEPFGVHIWNDTTVSESSAILQLETEIKNYSSQLEEITVLNQVLDQEGKKVKEVKSIQKLLPGKRLTIGQQTGLTRPKLWSPQNPYLYTIKTQLIVHDKVIDEVSTPYGIRQISWPVGKPVGNRQFLINGKPFFINGIAEYEHLLGQSHAFSNEQIRSRVMMIRSAGFNAFRDAHQPHNLAYMQYWDQLGMLCWTQMAAHIWYDTPAFRANFKSLLTDWVKERRNSPSVVLWGLENESTLPEDFARECTELIRKLDPTASSQRKVTTCNGGKGTDWDVPQNWTGTYGGNPLTYADDLQHQVLVGEYGAWRTLDLHTEGPFEQGGPYSENNMCQLIETKVRLAESVKTKAAGQFFWLFNSHDNPGRVQGGEGLRELDRVGPVNYKGLLSPWEEPLDVFYMFRANYAPKETEPMVYIVSHTWPQRWIKPGLKDSITIYSNCDEVELFNDADSLSLGRRRRKGIGTHFQWDKVNIRYNVLYAVGYVAGKAVAKDYIVLNNLPQAPHFNRFNAGAKNITAPANDYHYLYRINCGGPDYTDHNGSLWSADRQLTGNKVFGSSSWAAAYPGVPAFFASQRRTFDPVKGTSDWKLFQTFRYGRNKLFYRFPLPDGEYLVELYFIEPWLGTGGGMDCKGMRLFDVAVNDKTVLKDLDIWKEAGHDGALKKTLKVNIRGGQLLISFPQVKSGQALISAIAIAAKGKVTSAIKPAPAARSIIEPLDAGLKCSTWMDIGDQQYLGQKTTLTALPANLYGAEWIQAGNTSPQAIPFKVTGNADVFVANNQADEVQLKGLPGYEDTRTFLQNSEGNKFRVWRKRFKAGDTITIESSPVIAVVPVSHLQPAFDLKVVTTCKAIEATLKGKGTVKAALMGKERVMFKEPSGGSLEWMFKAGVADTYSLTIKYHNPFQRTLTGKIEVIAADGTLMKTSQAVFAPTKTDKWNYFTTSTGTMINAGSYKVKFTANDAAGLSIDALDVQ